MKKNVEIVATIFFTGVYLIGSILFYFLLGVGPSSFGWDMISFLIITYLMILTVWYLGMKSNLSNKWVILGALMILVFPSVNISKYLYMCEHSTYTQQRWENYPKDRALMVKGMEEEFDYLKMNEKEVIKLFGEPVKDTEKYMYFCEKKNENPKLVYSFYKEDRFFPYEQVLIFELDQEGKVIDYTKGVVDH